MPSFGKDISRKFYPLEDDEPINLLSQAPAIYLFSAMPSLADAQAGTGRITSHDIAYWLESSEKPYPRTYTISAINQPSVDVRSKGYWEAINYIAKAGGQTQTVLRQFEVEAIDETEEHPATTVLTLKEICPQVSAYFSDIELEQYIDNALEEMKLEFEANGIKWRDLFNLNKATKALAYKALSSAWLNQLQEDGDRFSIWAAQFKALYDMAIKTVKLRVDTDGDNQADVDATPKQDTRIFLR